MGVPTSQACSGVESSKELVTSSLFAGGGTVPMKSGLRSAGLAWMVGKVPNVTRTTLVLWTISGEPGCNTSRPSPVVVAGREPDGKDVDRGRHGGGAAGGYCDVPAAAHKQSRDTYCGDVR